jgi:hypothetical protein
MTLAARIRTALTTAPAGSRYPALLLPKPKARRQVLFPGIMTDAETLGVDRTTLYRALTGEWNLPGLRARYQQLKQKPQS